MTYDSDAPPLGSSDRAKMQLAALHLNKALRTCRNGQISLDSLSGELGRCLERLYANRAYGVILSGYYTAGVFGQYSVVDLLRRLAETQDYPTFLKQAYRFDASSQLSSEIDHAVAWHFSRNMHDAGAWQRKFAKLREQLRLRNCLPGDPSGVQVVDEGDTDTTTPPRIFQLRPMKSGRPDSLRVIPESGDDPYVVSQAARAKLERANALHRQTLGLLRSFLEARSVGVSETRLIDAYALLGRQVAIFEVKSITEENERDQVRHAVSQLYEYRYVHSIPDATVWIVCSRQLMSHWLVEYLLKDRGVEVLWVAGNTLDGPSLSKLEARCGVENAPL